jgi:hypothetical protein
MGITAQHGIGGVSVLAFETGPGPTVGWWRPAAMTAVRRLRTSGGTDSGPSPGADVLVRDSRHGSSW